MIPFFKKNHLSKELENLSDFYQEKLQDPRAKVQQYFNENFECYNFFLTKSCTQSLELAIMSLNISKGKEVILPSYGFVSLANAVAINGLKCVFVDCERDTMNISVDAIRNAISKDTAAIITINYSGVSCDYDAILDICKEHQLYLVEDNAHGIRCKYKGQPLGNFGDISTISFDYLKNISCGEGGGISINNERLFNRFIEAYYFGTNRQAFIEGKVNAYGWVNMGTNAQLAESLAVILLSQLKYSERIIGQYLSSWNFYYQELNPLMQEGKIALTQIPEYARHNGHMFWLKTSDKNERTHLMKYLKEHGIGSAFHYTPLHTSEFGQKNGVFVGEDKNTTKESDRLIRLPLYYLLEREEQEEVISRIYEFYQK